MFPRALTLITALLVMPNGAFARSEFLDFEVAAALASEHNEKMHQDIPIYMKGQEHPTVAKEFGTFRSNRPSNSSFRSDETACQRAFMSAIISLQDRARSEGGNAVINIYSDTRGSVLESATQYRCVAGNIVANVALKGTVVSLSRP